MQLAPEAILLIRERYGYVRAEVLQRLENRYKIFQVILTVVSVAVAVIYQLKWDYMGLLVCALFHILVLVLFGESRHLMLLSNYMANLERVLDNHYALGSLDIDALGWECSSRSSKSNKAAATRWLFWGAIGFFFCLYSFFNVVGSRWLAHRLAQGLRQSPDLSWVQAPDTWLVVMIVQLPCFLLINFMNNEYRRFWKSPPMADDLADPRRSEKPAVPAPNIAEPVPSDPPIVRGHFVLSASLEPSSTMPNTPPDRA